MKRLRVVLAALVLLAAFAPAASSVQTQSPQSICEQLVRSGVSTEELGKSGCCSWHGGVCGCHNGRAVCCDGQLSPSCGC